MSHHATNWAIQQRGLPPATKLVLWYLADRHNPDFGCFPSQEQLAEDAEMSRSSVCNHLRRLQEMGLIRRQQRIDPKTRRQQSTRYILGFEKDFAQGPSPDFGHGADDAAPGTEVEQALEPCPDIAHGAVSKSESEPCPNSSESRVQILDTNPVREPLREPVKEEGAQARFRSVFSEGFWEALLQALGFHLDAELPDWWQGEKAKAHVLRWHDELGLSEDVILTIAAASRRYQPEPPEGPKALDRLMKRARGSRKAEPQAQRQATEQEKLAFFAEWLNGDRPLPSSAISGSVRDALLAAGLVTPERMRERGIR